MRYEQVYDREWVQPIRRGYKMRCCDCGLVHRMDFRIFRGRVQFRASRDERATAAIRRRRPGRRQAFAIADTLITLHSPRFDPLTQQVLPGTVTTTRRRQTEAPMPMHRPRPRRRTKRQKTRCGPTGKVCYAHGDALYVLARMQEHDSDADPFRPLHAYVCEHGDHYHIGHMPAWLLRGERQRS